MAATDGLPVIKLEEGLLSRTLYEMEATKDLTLIAGNGEEVKCHSLILEVRSPSLAAKIWTQNEDGSKRVKLDRVEMKDNSEAGLNHLVRYLYGFEISPEDLPCEIAVELYKTARQYELAELKDGLFEAFLQKKEDWLTVPALMELHFYTAEVGGFLFEKTVRLLSNFPADEIRASAQWKLLEAVGREKLLWELVDSLKLRMKEAELQLQRSLAIQRSNGPPPAPSLFSFCSPGQTASIFSSTSGLPRTSSVDDDGSEPVAQTFQFGGGSSQSSSPFHFGSAKPPPFAFSSMGGARLGGTSSSSNPNAMDVSPGPEAPAPAYSSPLRNVPERRREFGRTAPPSVIPLGFRDSGSQFPSSQASPSPDQSPDQNLNNMPATRRGRQDRK